jgi:hypothetical protein
MARASPTLTAIDDRRARVVAAALHLPLGVAERAQHGVVLVLAERGLALALEDPDHPEGDVLDPDNLAERIALSEEIARDGLPDERHLGRALDLFLAEEAAIRHVPLAGREELPGDALDARGPVQVGVHDLGAAPRGRRRGCDGPDLAGWPGVLSDGRLAPRANAHAAPR